MKCTSRCKDISLYSLPASQQRSLTWAGIKESSATARATNEDAVEVLLRVLELCWQNAAAQRRPYLAGRGINGRKDVAECTGDW